MIQAFENEFESTDPGNVDRIAYFVTIGSQNQDRRGMLLDGEVLVTVAGYEALVTLMDFAFFMKVAVWLESSEDLDLYFPEGPGFLKSLWRSIRNLI